MVDINQEESEGVFNLNTVKSLYSFIKETYEHCREVATKYINYYNTLFSVALRRVDNLRNKLFLSLGTVSQSCYWHGVKDVQKY